MGSFYVNYTLRGPSPQAVAKALAGRSAMVTPEQDGCVVVYDEESDDQDHDVLSPLALRLSKELGCPVLVVLNHDDDALWFQLCVGGELVDEYDSAPDYFDSDTEEPAEPKGGNARKLCEAFGVKKSAAVEEVLRKAAGSDEGYTFESERHEDLAHALGIPSFAVGYGYGAIVDCELPDELDGDDLIEVT